MEKAKNILIYRLGSLGDTIMALPCFHKVREAYPDAHITLLTNRPVMNRAAPLEAVLGNRYFFDEVLDYPIGTRSFKLLLKLIREIRHRKIDTIINLTAARTRTSTVRDELFFKAAGIKTLIGFPKNAADFGLFVDNETGQPEWEAKRLTRRILALGAIDLDDDRYWDMLLTEDEQNEAVAAIRQVSPESPFIAINTGTKVQANDWSISNWTSLLSGLRQTMPGYKLIVIGAHDDVPVATQCIEVWGGNSIDLCGKTSPRVSAAILKHASVFIGHDSGPMHLSACVGTPCVGIFSARNLPYKWFPRGKLNQIIYHRTDCAGCGLQVCIAEQKKCILSITVDEVHEAVKKALENRSVPLS